MLPTIIGYALSIHKLQGNTSDRLLLNVGEHSLLPDSCFSAACGPRRSKDSRFSHSQSMNASYICQSHQCSSEERRMRRDSNTLSIRPLKNIAMPIRWISQSSQFRISIHVRRMKTRFQVRTITILDFVIQIARWLLFIRYVIIKPVPTPE